MKYALLEAQSRYVGRDLGLVLTEHYGSVPPDTFPLVPVRLNYAKVWRSRKKETPEEFLIPDNKRCKGIVKETRKRCAWTLGKARAGGPGASCAWRLLTHDTCVWHLPKSSPDSDRSPILSDEAKALMVAAIAELRDPTIYDRVYNGIPRDEDGCPIPPPHLQEIASVLPEDESRQVRRLSVSIIRDQSPPMCLVRSSSYVTPLQLALVR